MHALDTAWPWITLMLLGAFHGLNPAMGWLFAVAIGFQERRTASVVRALGPITLGHALAISMVAIPFGLLGLVIPQQMLLVLIGLVLLGFAGYKLASRFRHPRWVGMRVRPHELMLWSFLMATAHGAGLMIVPVLAGMRGDAVPSAVAASGHAGHMANMPGMENMPGMDHPSAHHMSAGGDALLPAVSAVALHTAAMLLVTGLIALVVYRKVGVDVLRRAWINLDLIWVGAFVVVGMMTLGVGLWGMVG